MTLDGFNAPLMVFATLLVAAVLGGSTRLRRGDVARLLLNHAANLLTFAARDFEVVALGCAVSSLVVATALPRGKRRVFALYQGLSVALLLGALGCGRGTVFAVLVTTSTLLRKGILPTHSWVLPFFEGAPPGLAAVFVGEHLGVYALLRAALAYPEAFQPLLGVVAGLSIATSVYAAVLGLVQRDLRRVLACLGMSQSAFVLVGLGGGDASAASGSLAVWLTIGLSMMGLALAVTAIEARVGRVDLGRFGGLGARSPRLATLYLLSGLACIGIPGTAGFASEDLLLHGILESYPVAGIGMIVATALNGFTLLRSYFQVFHGPATDVPPVGDLLLRERLTLLGVLALVFVFGFVPQPILATRVETGERIAAVRGPHPGH